MKKTGFLIFGTGVWAGAFLSYRLLRETVFARKEELENCKRQFFLLKRWLMQEKGMDKLRGYLTENGVKRAAIYGMEHLGQCMAHKLRDPDCGLEALYGIDADKVSSEIEIYRPEDPMPEADLVIVTALPAYESVKEGLQKKFSCPIVSLEEII